MTAIDRPGYWRVTTGSDGQPDAEPIDGEEGRRLIKEGAKEIVRVEHDANGLIAFQHSGAVLLLPNGQAMPNGVFTVLWES